MFIHERHRERQREKQAPCREPDAGLHPRMPGSQPEPKTDAQPLNHQVPLTFLKRYFEEHSGLYKGKIVQLIFPFGII